MRSQQPPWRKTINGLRLTFAKEEGGGHDEVPSSLFIGVSQAREWKMGELNELIRYLNMARGLLHMQEEEQWDSHPTKPSS